MAESPRWGRFTNETPQEREQPAWRRQQETAEQREYRVAQRRQRDQHSDHKHVQRLRQNVTIIYTADEAGEERELRLPTLQDIRQRLRCTVKIIFFDATIGGKGYTTCTVHVKNIFPTDWVKPVSLYTMSNNGFYSKLYFTMNSLEHRYNVWHV